jgi:hypothetical protein
MSKHGLAGIIAVGLLIIGVFVGTAGFHVASTYQTKTVTLTSTTTQQDTTTQTQISISTSTLVESTTRTQISLVTSTSTTSIYPVPTNVTVAFVQDNGAYQYTIDAGTNTLTSTPLAPLSFPLTGLFPGEQITISASSYGDRSGETVTVELFVNGQMVQQSTTLAGGDPAQITYTV